MYGWNDGMEERVSDHASVLQNIKKNVNKEYVKVHSFSVLLLGSLHASLCIIFETFLSPEARGFSSH